MTLTRREFGLQVAATGSLKGFQRLWNGKNFDDFEVDTAAVWKIRGGAIVGRHEGLKYNEFLRTKKKYKNFELRAGLRLIDGFGNSGIQFRSVPVPNSHEVSGYQADAGEKYWGALYDESRRKKVLAGPPEALLAKLNTSAWHLYIVRAQGSHITIEVDGQKTVDYTEKDAGILQEGFIALQVHSDAKPVEVWFRDLIIKAL
ncbi:MAG: DUF1080 domain-containing protein [Bryobacteraceae bacterium]|nr:DUF1080 domain-containing protein [Bryobacteraceae bacterium]